MPHAAAPRSPDDDSAYLDPVTVEADFLDSYGIAYGTGDDIVHLAAATSERLAANHELTHAALDNGITLAILEPDDGSSYFNLGLLLADLGQTTAAIFSLLGAVHLLDEDDPDRLSAAERATSIAAELGLHRAVDALKFRFGFQGDESIRPTGQGL